MSKESDLAEARRQLEKLKNRAGYPTSLSESEMDEVEALENKIRELEKK